MDSSFFEYRDRTGVDSGSDDTEIIDNSLVEDLASKKKNRTAFVAESDEATTDDDIEDEILRKNVSKSVVRRSSVAELHVISSSEDDASKRGSIRRPSDISHNNVVLSSSDEEEELSPEMLPRRRPPIRPSNDSNQSIIGRKNKKRMILMDSDTENSIVIEHDRHKKLVCLKDTPLKIADNKEENRKVNDSEQEVDDESEGEESDSENHPGDDENNDEDDENNDEDYDGPDEDELVMSRATRMSIMGVIPKGNDSDESDFIQSDDSSRKSGSISRNSLPDSDSDLIPPNTDNIPKLPHTETDIPKTPEKTTEALDDSQLTCSPFTSPLHDITKEVNESFNNASNVLKDKNDSGINVISANDNKTYDLTNDVPNNLLSKVNKENFIRYDDDVTIIDSKPEIIALSSDDEDVVQVEKKSPKMKKSPKLKVERGTSSSNRENTITQYLAPPSYPNQQVVYVKKAVKENELSKLNSLNADLFDVRRILETMDLDSLPDGGRKLIERLSILESEVRRQGDKVANMIVEPDKPTAKDIAQDGFEKGLTWEEIQKASTAVQPRMFGKQAMATHMHERNLILDRLRDLHAALGSRPAETDRAPQPAALTTQLMPHQLHALAWLHWRETQRPRAGILADDMGLGKTITMIALMASDKHGIDEDEDDDDNDEPGRSRAKLTRGGTLVVCPASLMQQWGGEVSAHVAPHKLSVCLHHGPARATQPHRLAVADLVVTTYNILQRDHEKNGVLMRILWRRVILDEAHIVRNHKAATSVAVSGLRASRRWCLTGTPVQNKDLDLFALLKFLRCTPFDDLTMWKKWIDNKSIGGQERLSTIMRCILLRRTKAQLQQKGQLDCLPQRDTHQQLVTLTKPEMNVYQKVLVFSKTLFAQFLHQRADKNADAQSFTAGKQTEYDKMHKKMIALQGAKPVKSHEILVLLLRLRQVCCHCGLIAAMLDEESSADVEEDPAGKDLLAELNKLSLDDSRSKRMSGQKDEEDDEPTKQEGTTAAEAIRSVLSPNNPVFELSRQSSKISAVMECLNKNVFSNKSDKAVVVSQWTSVLRLVEAELHKSKIKTVTLSGNVPVPARPPLIQAINDPNNQVRVMLLSLCAGGVGLNLCGANHLLLLDPHWNPQLEEQAQDRIYRVGQKKHVHIYRFMCVDTVEQNIRKLQEAKLELADNVLTGAKNTNASKLSIEDLKMLFNMGQ